MFKNNWLIYHFKLQWAVSNFDTTQAIPFYLAAVEIYTSVQCTMVASPQLVTIDFPIHQFSNSLGLFESNNQGI